MAALNDIRSTFIDFFKKQGHKEVQSSSLVPHNDPTLMFANSGMVQFKNLFTGLETRDYNRAVTSQKCVRAGGKHNDLDNVGFTARHLTFFEMLGNFSFGDYFKEAAIPFAWEMVTRELGIPKDKLLVTVYHTDDEAADLWKKVAGLSDDRIIRINSDDNFWRMGPTGPNGPSSEIFYDHGDHIFGGPPGSADEDGDRFIEIWNLVFMQFETLDDGTSRDLPKKSIDTGMGLERIASLLQGTNNVFETDLMKALVEASAQVTNTDLDPSIIQYHRVMADHLRSTAFLIAEGVLPSNEGRGYVLRRIMRRAMRYGHLLGAKDPVMHRLVPELVRQMGAAYPELIERQAAITDTLFHEEERFRQTLDRGLKLLDVETANFAEGDKLAGETAFKLYDTFGFPLDLTQDALRTRGIGVDTDGFNAAMAAQKAQARAAWAGTGAAADNPIWFDLADKHGVTEFLGYDAEAAEGQVLAIIQEGAAVDTVTGAAEMIVNQTPFYAESGGQVGDQGVIIWQGGRARVSYTQKRAGLFVHAITVEEGALKRGDGVRLVVDHDRRARIRANHSATHLVNEALRRVLGDHVAQKGSLNAEDRLRFDFSHQNALSDGEIKAVNQQVNAYIRQNTPVTTRIMTPDEARALGAQALFGEKYGDEVRVVSMGRDAGSGKGADGDTYSIELCGGTHVTRTGDIGAFSIISDSASAAGVRRVEALTGQAALDYLGARDDIVSGLSNTLKAKPDEIAERLRQIQEQARKQAAEINELKRALATGGGAQGAEDIETINNHQFIAKRLDGVSGKDLPPIMDALRGKIENGVIALFAIENGRVAVAIGTVGERSHSAKDLIGRVTPEIGGKGGGGRPDLAQGGGNNPEGIASAINVLRAAIKG